VRDGIGSPVMKTRQKLEFCNVQLVGRDTEFVIELSNSGVLGSHDASVGHVFGSVDFGRFHPVKGMRAACVRPDLVDIYIDIEGGKKGERKQ